MVLTARRSDGLQSRQLENFPHDLRSILVDECEKGLIDAGRFQKVELAALGDSHDFPSLIREVNLLNPESHGVRSSFPALAMQFRCRSALLIGANWRAVR